MSVMAGTKKAAAAQEFINLALSTEVQTELAKALKAGPVNGGATVPAAYRGQPGIFLTPAEWKDKGYILNDDVRARTCRAGASGHRQHRQVTRAARCVPLTPAVLVVAGSRPRSPPLRQRLSSCRGRCRPGA
jgi:hypothetical protein